MDPSNDHRLTALEQRMDAMDNRVSELHGTVTDSVAVMQQNHNEIRDMLIANNRVSVSLFSRLASSIAALWRRSPRA